MRWTVRTRQIKLCSRGVAHVLFLRWYIKQLENAKEQILKEKDYLIAIEKKTSILLSACTEIGAITAQATPDTQQQCREFGRLLGYCFQIRDDIFDYFDDPVVGKPSGNDIREGKVTLPLLYALESTDESTKAPYLMMIRGRDFSPENVAALINFAKKQNFVKARADQIQIRVLHSALCSAD